MNTDAKLDAPAVGAAQRLFAGRGLLNSPCRLAGPVGMVFNRVRPAEHRKAAVARIANQQAAGFFDRAFKVVEDAIQELVRLIRIEVGDVASGIDRVDGEHRQHAAFRKTGRAVHRPQLRNCPCGKLFEFYQKMTVARQRNQQSSGHTPALVATTSASRAAGPGDEKSPRPLGQGLDR